MDFNCLVVVLDDGNCGVPVSCGHDECHVHLQRVIGHVLDEILVPWCRDDGVVPLVRMKLSRVRLPFLLLAVHVEPFKQCEGTLAQALSLPLQPRTRHVARFVGAESLW